MVSMVNFVMCKFLQLKKMKLVGKHDEFLFVLDPNFFLLCELTVLTELEEICFIYFP